MKKSDRKYCIIPFLLSPFLLTSCFLSSRAVETNLEVVSHWQEDGTLVFKSNLDNQAILSNSGIEALNSLGEQKILVVPVNFLNSKKSYGDSSLNTFTYDNELTALEKGFFGSSEETGWESVSSYYYKSSYGKLKITGEVTEVVTLNRESIYYNTLVEKGQSPVAITNQLAEECISKLEKKMDLSAYDQNGDGKIDALWLVYSEDYDVSSDLLWAYTTTSSREQKKKKYKVGTYAWASYDFFNEGSYEKPDAHTFIHETGHILGLDDYYSYDDIPDAPLGALDMMDFNIGDHNAFSKYLLDWVEPRVISDKGTYKLKKFQTTGDCIILAYNYNGTPFCEYLMLEYYTPTDINYKDSNSSYKEGYPKMYSENGLRIIHVDARAGYISENSFSGYNTWNGKYDFNLKYYKKSDSCYLGLIANNSEKYSFNDYNLVELISKNTSGMINGTIADNSDLFYEADTLENYKFNDDTFLQYSISVESITDEEITINIA